MKSSNWKTVLILGVGLAAINQGAAFAQSTSTPASIAARLQAVEDRAAVEQLITSDYSTALDTRDWKAFGALFTADADFRLFARQFPPRKFKGSAAIQASLIPPSEPAGALPSNGYAGSLKHVITNPRVQLDGDRATATAYWMEVALDKNLRPSVVSTGHYRDVLKRDNGRWKFQIRDVFAYDMAPVAKGEPAASPAAPTAQDNP